MARGWDSKSVEEQIEAARDAVGAEGADLPLEQRRLRREREGLLSQRKRLLDSLERCTNDRYRQTLEGGLAYLEARLAEIPPPPDR